MKRLCSIASAVSLAFSALCDTEIYLNLSDLTWVGSGTEFFSAWGSGDVTAGLVSRWTFDDNTTDSVGTNNGVWTGTAAYATGKIGKAASLDGGSYITVSTDGRADFALQEYTVCAWVNAASSTPYLPIWSYDYTSHSSIYYAESVAVYPDGRINYSWNNGVSLEYIETSYGTFAMSQWNHIVVTFKAGEQKIYLNGSEIQSGSSSATVTYYQQFVWIGKANFAVVPACLIDDARFYGRALTQSEISKIYSLGTSE